MIKQKAFTLPTRCIACQFPFTVGLVFSNYSNNTQTVKYLEPLGKALKFNALCECCLILTTRLPTICPKISWVTLKTFPTSASIIEIEQEATWYKDYPVFFACCPSIEVRVFSHTEHVKSRFTIGLREEWFYCIMKFMTNNIGTHFISPGFI